MTVAAPQTAFTTANRHALATILDASQTKSIIASRDIFDIAGVKLWAREQPVSTALQRKLIDRQLRNPLESCLLAEDGVTTATLVQSLEQLFAAPTPLAALLRPRAAALLREARHLPLHSVAQLLLTAGQASRPAAYTHAVQAMALAGTLMVAHGGGTAELRTAMLCGLLHDLGEMYIDPRFGEADADRSLDFQSYQQLVVHPHVGQLLVAQLTDYPKPIARGIAEHHERLDGSGYPHALDRDAVSPLGRMLAVTEAALAALRGDGASLARASVALRVVPGEFDLTWIGRIADASRLPSLGAAADPARLQQALKRLDAGLASALASAETLADTAGHPSLQGALALARHLLGRLRTGWYASGSWTPDAIAPQDAAEIDAVARELAWRLGGIERAVRLRAGELPAADAERLETFAGVLQAAVG